MNDNTLSLSSKASYSMLRGIILIKRIERISEYAQLHLNSLYDKTMNKVHGIVQRHLNDIYIKSIDKLYGNEVKEEKVNELSKKQAELLKVLSEMKLSESNAPYSHTLIDNFRSKNVRLLRMK